MSLKSVKVDCLFVCVLFICLRIVYLFVYCFTSHSKFFYLYGDVAIAGESRAPLYIVNDRMNYIVQLFTMYILGKYDDHLYRPGWYI
jgi:hypothetical protein